MKYLKYLQGIALVVIILLLSGVLPSTKSRALGAVPSNGGFPGIFNTTLTDLTIPDGYGSALAIDNHGRLILSPSSTAISVFSTPAAITVIQTTATAIFGSSTPVAHQITLQAAVANTDKIIVGDSNTSLTRGIQLVAGSSYSFEVADASSIYAVSASSGQKLNVEIR